MKRLIQVGLMTALCTVLAVSLASAAGPRLIPYQGRLTDAAGNPLTGTHDIRFSIWSSATAGSEQWFEVQVGVTVTNGLFDVMLGSVATLTPAVLNSTSRFLEIKVGADAPMTPRQQLGSAPYAMQVLGMPGAANVASNAGVSWNTTPTVIVSRTINAPEPGFVLAWATSQVNISHTTGGSSIGTHGVSRSTTTFPISQDISMGVPSGAPSGSYFHASTVHGLFSVPAGNTTVHYLGQGTASRFSVNDPNLTLLFVPASYGAIQSSDPQGISSIDDNDPANTDSGD